jgi:polyhydroxyalkanoate synthase
MILNSPLIKKIISYERKAVSDFSVIYQENKFRVLKVNSASTTDKTPVLLLPAMINRYYILDINSENSLCRDLSEKGHPVYVIDWGEATPEDRWYTFTDIFLGTLKRIITKVSRDAKAKPVLFGYCMGGTISAIYTACFPEVVKGLIALTAPIDFSRAGIMSKWTSEKYLNPGLLVDSIGNMTPEMTQNSFISLKPEKWLKKWETAWKKQDNPEFTDSFLNLENWVNDNVPFPGGIWQEYIKWLYQENRFFNDNLYIGEFKASLKNISCPVLTLIASDDHIVPPESAEPLHQLAGSKDKTVKYFNGGHVGIISSRKLFPQLTATVENWLEKI